MRKYPLFVLFFILLATGHTQNRTIDSLQNLLQIQKEDTNKVNILNALWYNFYQHGDFQHRLQYAKQALDLAEKLNFQKGIIAACFGTGDSYTALKYSEKAGDKQNMANALQNIGAGYLAENNNDEALKNLLATLKIREDIRDTIGIAQTYNTLVRVYINQGNYDEALKKALTALKIFEGLNMPEGWLAMTYDRLGMVYEKQGDVASDKATAAFKYQEALLKYKLSLKGWEKLGRKDGVGEEYASIGNIYLKLNNPSEARNYLEKGLQLSKENNYRWIIQQIYLTLSQLDSLERNFAVAYEHYKEYARYLDSSLSEEAISNSTQDKLQYELGKKEDSLKLRQALTEERLKQQQLEVKTAKLKQNIFILGGLSFLVVGFVLYRNHQQKQKAFNLLERQQMRTRIASDLHDDIGSTLTSISYYSELIKMQLKANDASLKPMLDKIGGSARNTINAMSDIVWIINPQNDTTTNLVSRMKRYAAEMLGVRNIEYTFNTSEAIEETELDMQQRKNIYLIYKEAVHNAVKYSACSNIEIDFMATDHTISLSIRDNGKGFDIQHAGDGNGLINIKKRSEEINANLVICSAQDNGTQIKLACKIT